MRPVTFNDAFGIFLAPFLAAATIVNLSWKEKQKKDWDNTLAEIDKDIEILRAREHEILNRLQLGAATRLANRHERRTYSTAALAPSNQSTDVPARSPYDLEPEPELLPVENFSKTVQDALQHQPTPFALPASLEESVESATIEDVPEVVWEAERLIAMRLALELVVMARLGGSPAVVDMGSSLPPPPEAESQHTASLVEQLRRVKHLESAAMRKPRRHSGFIPDHMDDTSGHFMSLLHHLTDSYKNGNLTYVQLLENICEALVNSRAPPTIRHYTSLVKFLHDHHFSPYAPLVISAISRSRLMLDEIACERVLEHIGHTRDVKAFDWWLAEFTKVNSRLLSTQRWEWHRLSGLRLPLPSSLDPRLIKTLTFTALQLEQFPRAEAWASVMVYGNYRGETWADLIKAFLAYYTRQEDWTQGRVWIREVIDTPTLADKGAFRSFKDFGTLIYRMLALCVECGKRSQYAEILRAAVAANVKPPEIDTRRTGSPGERKPGASWEKALLAILSEWSWMIDTGPSGRELTDEMRVVRFQEGLRISDLYKELESLGEGPSHSGGSLPARQQATLDELAAQLSQSKQRLDQQLEEARKLHDSLQTMLKQHVNGPEDSGSQFQTSAQIPEDRRWEEQQSALTSLQEELSRHRELIYHEMKERRQQQYHLQSQSYQAQDMQQDPQEVKQDSSLPLSDEDSDNRRPTIAVVQNKEIERSRRDVASMDEIAKGVDTHSPLSSSISEPASDSLVDASPQSPVSKSDSDVKIESTADTDSDSGYSSDSSNASRNGQGVNDETPNRHTLMKGFAGMDEKGSFLGAEKFWGALTPVGLEETPWIPVTGNSSGHRADIDYPPGRDETSSPNDDSLEGDTPSAEGSVEATAEFFDTIDSMYPVEPPTVADPAPSVPTEDSESSVQAATSAMHESAPTSVLTTTREGPQPVERSSARRLILDMEAGLDTSRMSSPSLHEPTQETETDDPAPKAKALKQEDAPNFRIRRQHNNNDQKKLNRQAKTPPTFRIRKHFGFGGVDSLRRERRLKVASFHAEQKIKWLG